MLRQLVADLRLHQQMPQDVLRKKPRGLHSYGPRAWHLPIAYGG